MANRFRFELNEANFLDANINPNFSITFDPPALWYSQDARLLYDHTSEHKLYTKKADDDTQTVSIIVDFGDDVEIDIIKFLNINFKDLTIKRKRSTESVFTTIISYSNISTTSIHWESDDLGLIGDSLPLRKEDYGIILKEDGDYLLTETNTTGRYFQFDITTTQIANQEKYIGELYMGRRYLKLETGRVIDYNEDFNDPRGIQNRDYKGRSILDRVNSVYNSSVTIKGLSSSEYVLVRDLAKKGGIYELFPSAAEFTPTDIADFSIDDVYLVETKARWVVNPWGENARGIVKLDFMETSIAST